MAKALKAISVLSLGGTIAMARDASGGVSPAVNGEDLLAAVPELLSIADVSSKSVANTPSAYLKFQDIANLAVLIQQEIAAGAEGIVVTQGTDTLEETAAILDVLVAGPTPIIITGAMRSASQAGAEGPANLLASVVTAASEQVRGLGTLVVMNDEIHAARYVRKHHTQSVAAFSSPEAGPLGRVAEGAVKLFWKPAGRSAALPVPASFDKRIALISLGMDDDGELVRLAHQGGYAGIVVAGVGAGHASPAAAAHIERAARDLPVLLASRVSNGPMPRHTYNYVGSEIDLAERGVIMAGVANAVRARALLAVLVNLNYGKHLIESFFADQAPGQQ